MRLWASKGGKFGHNTDSDSSLYNGLEIKKQNFQQNDLPQTRSKSNYDTNFLPYAMFALITHIFFYQAQSVLL